MSTIAFVVWLIGAIIADLLGFIPLIGILPHWAFAIAFSIYKFFSGQKSSTYLVSVFDILAGELPLPVNVTDVVATYFMSKATQAVGKAA